MKTLFAALFFIPAIFTSCTCYAICLVKGKDTVTILNTGKIGFTTKTDTIEYDNIDGLWWEIVHITTEDIVVRRPSVYRDTTVRRNKGDFNDIPDLGPSDFRIVDRFRENKERRAEILLVSAYEYKNFKTADIRTVYYPPQVDNQTGCTVCILVYPLTYYQMSKRWQPRSYNMKRWKFVDTVKHDTTK